MNDKLKTALVLEGPDLMIGSLLMIAIIKVFMESWEKYLTIFYVLGIVGTICFIGSFIYCFIHIIKDKSISKGIKALRLILLFVFNLLYIPLYYTRNVIKKMKWAGIVEVIVFLIAIPLLFVIAGVKVLDKYYTEDHYSNDLSVVVNLPESWVCYNKDIGDQKIFCLNVLKSTSFGVFRYSNITDFDKEKVDILSFHSDEESKGYVKEGYKINKVDKKDNYYITELKKDGSKFYVVASIKKIDESNALVMIYNATSMDNFQSIYDAIRYNSEVDVM